MKGNDQADRPVWKVTIINSLHLGRSEVLRSLGHYPWAQSQEHDTINCLEERVMERGSPQKSFLKGWKRAIVNQTNVRTVSKATLGKLLRQDGVHVDFSTHIVTILTWTELKWLNYKTHLICKHKRWKNCKFASDEVPLERRVWRLASRVGLVVVHDL